MLEWNQWRRRGLAFGQTSLGIKRVLISSPDPVAIFILSYERPLYLWACLDSLYRNTKYPCHFIIADNNSQDPLVKRVIVGFERRGMFHAVHFCEENLPKRFEWMLNEHRDLLGTYWVSCESDVMVMPSTPCWLERFTRHMKSRPKLSMLGSYIDTSDFASPEQAKNLYPEASEEELAALIKLHSPERDIDNVDKAPIITPFNPPGRLLMMLTETLDKAPIQRDSLWHQTLLSQGYETGIATDVLHRHLSLMNIFDHPSYDMKLRDEFFDGLKK